MSSSFKLLSFDLDDTLWPCAPTIKVAEQLLYQWLQQHVPMITQKYDIKQLHQKRRIFAKLHPHLLCNLSLLRIKTFEQLALEFSLDNHWIEEAFDVYYQARQQVNLFDDVVAVLDELKPNYLLASLTNGNADAKLTGISHWFSYSLNSIQIGKLKSEPDIYQHLHQLTKISAHQHIHIGDDPVQDIAGAQSAGVFSIWLNRQNLSWTLDGCQPDAQINNLTQLVPLLARL